MISEKNIVYHNFNICCRSSHSVILSKEINLLKPKCGEKLFTFSRMKWMTNTLDVFQKLYALHIPIINPLLYNKKTV